MYTWWSGHQAIKTQKRYLAYLSALVVSNLLCIQKSTGRKAIIISWLSLQVYFEMDFPQVWNSGSMVMSSYVLINSFYVLHCFATGSTN
jgi:hypothetical protein